MNHNISEAVRCAKHSEHYDIMYLAQAVGELLETLAQPEHEPVVIPDCGEAGHADGACGNRQCLPNFKRNTTPPQRKPLSDEQTIILKDTTCPEIDWKARHGVEMNNGERNQWMLDWFRAFKVAIEAAHGIQENT